MCVCVCVFVCVCVSVFLSVLSVCLSVWYVILEWIQECEGIADMETFDSNNKDAHSYFSE